MQFAKAPQGLSLARSHNLNDHWADETISPQVRQIKFSTGNIFRWVIFLY